MTEISVGVLNYCMCVLNVNTTDGRSIDGWSWAPVVSISGSRQNWGGNLNTG